MASRYKCRPRSRAAVLAGLSLVAVVALPFAVGSAAGASKTSATIDVLEDIRSLNPDIQFQKPIVPGITSEILQAPTGLKNEHGKLKVIPVLATSWRRISPTTWRFKLRKGVKFSNGEPLTAQAVAKSFSTYTAPSNANGQVRFVVGAFKSVVAVNATTFNITTATPNAAVPDYATFLFVLPPTYYAQVGAAQFGLKPVGTGPYELSSWQPGGPVALKRNPTYWGPKPKISTLTVQTVPDAATRVSALQTGAANIVTELTPNLKRRVESIKGAKWVSVRSGTRVMLIEKPTGVLKNVKLRRAINHAVNRKAIINGILKGASNPMAGLFLPGELGRVNKLSGSTYNPALARKLLGGKKYHITVNYVQGLSVFDEQVAEIIQAQLKKVGISSTLKFITEAQAGDWMQPSANGVFLITWNLLYPDASWVLAGFLAPGGAWSSLASNPVFGTLKNKGLATANVKKREKVYLKVQQLAVNKLSYWVPLYQLRDLYGVTKGLNWKPSADLQYDMEAASWG